MSDLSALLRRLGFYETLARELWRPPDIEQVLRWAELPREHLPVMVADTTPARFWSAVGRILEQHDWGHDGARRLLAAARRWGPGVAELELAHDLALRPLGSVTMLGPTVGSSVLAAARAGDAVRLDLRLPDGSWRLGITLPSVLDVGEALRQAGVTWLTQSAASAASLSRRRPDGEEPLPPTPTLGDLHLSAGDVVIATAIEAPPPTHVVHAHDASDAPRSGGPIDAGDLIADRYRARAPAPWWQGPHSRVYRAVDERSDAEVAVKFGATELGAREARLLSIARPMGVVRLVDAFTLDGEPVLVTAWVDGRPFPSAGAPWKELEPALMDLLEALARLHGAGLIHGDLKPDNVILAAQGGITLLDLGFAMVVDRGRSGLLDGSVPGTRAYAAPELVTGVSAATPASDLYAVGVMVIDALLGRELSAEARATPARWEAVTRALPPAVRAWLARLISPDRLDRPANAAVALQQLRALRSGLSVPPRAADAELERRLVALPPRATIAEIEGIFEAENRLQMLRSRAAAELVRRVGTDRADLRAELSRWLRAGLVRLGRSGVAISAAEVLTLEAGALADDALASTVELPGPLSQRLEAQIFWIALGGRDAPQVLLAHLAGLDEATWRAGAQELVARGLVAAGPDDRLLDRTGSAALYLRSIGERAEAHAALAALLPRGAPARLAHLLQADRVTEAVHEAMFQARQALQTGHLALATHRLELAARWSADLAPSPERERLHDEYTLLALQTESAEVLRTAAELLRRAAPVAPELLTLLDCALRTVGGLARDALPALESLPPIEREPRLEAWRAALVFQARARLPGGLRSGPIRAAMRLGRRTNNRALLARATMAEGWRCYWAERPQAAITAFSRALELRDLEHERIASLIALGSALLEAGRLDEAELHLSEALGRARETGHALAARAAWLLRRLAWQRGGALEPDLELIAAAEALGNPAELAVIVGTEAGVAWHAALPTLAHLLARRAAQLAGACGARIPAVLYWALALHLGEPAAPDELRALATAAREMRAPLAELQALALILSRMPAPALLRRAQQLRRQAGRRVQAPHHRLDILHLAEIDALLDAADRHKKSG